MENIWKYVYIYVECECIWNIYIYMMWQYVENIWYIYIYMGYIWNKFVYIYYGMYMESNMYGI